MAKKKLRFIDTRNWENLQIRKYWYPDCGKFEIPLMHPCETCDVKRWVSFNYAPGVPMDERRETGVHFNVDDYQFNRVWDQPKKALELLKTFGAVTNPDFSIYNDFPDAVRIYNVYRNRWCGRWWQDNGVNVVPLINFSREDSFEWCFTGYPENSIVMISFVGNHNRFKTEPDKWLVNGWNKMIELCAPRKILLYGRPYPFIYDCGVPIEEIKSFSQELDERSKAKRAERKALEEQEKRAMGEDAINDLQAFYEMTP